MIQSRQGKLMRACKPGWSNSQGEGQCTTDLLGSPDPRERGVHLRAPWEVEVSLVAGGTVP